MHHCRGVIKSEVNMNYMAIFQQELRTEVRSTMMLLSYYYGAQVFKPTVTR
jgi:hypothetical protein